MAEVKKQISTNWYKKFDQIDGSHPLKSVIPEGYIDYPARIRKGGKVSYFNFSLAKEMGLIPKSHADELTMELKEKILSTFSIQIINEYDQMNNKKFPKDEIKAGTYMATRYLQLQHDDKKGRTSGDGRSIWNGQIKHNHKTWDISSCGTGATRLSPATSKYNKFFETGDPTISYGCGYAEFDEGLATAILSHIFNANQQSTEQTLAIIEFKNNISINVRVHENLLRPSHIFLYLKQDRLEELKSLLDYYIERQREKEDWSDCPSSQKKYDYLGDKIASTFGALSADLEDEYIFCWLDWDGIGFLGAGAIIQGRGSVTGLTTAATIWVVAAIGYTIGVGYPFVATLFSVTVLIILRLLHPINRFIEKEKDYKNFHIEMISYGSVKQTVEHILEMEEVETLSIVEEDHTSDPTLSILNLYVRGHYRAIERISSEMTDAIKIKKVNYREILTIPSSILVKHSI